MFSFEALALNVNVFVCASYALSVVDNAVVFAGVQLTVACLYPSAAFASGNLASGTTSPSAYINGFAFASKLSSLIDVVSLSNAT